MTWTPERIDILRQHYADGLSSSQIANEIGGITRNAVIGKVNRLGLTRDGHPSSANTGGKRRHRPVPRRHAPFRLKPEAPPAPEPMPDIADENIPLEQRRTLDQLTNTTCRWPVGTPGRPDFFYCGHESADLSAGRPYCAMHHARAFAGHGRAPDRFPWGARA